MMARLASSSPTIHADPATTRGAHRVAGCHSRSRPAAVGAAPERRSGARRRAFAAATSRLAARSRLGAFGRSAARGSVGRAAMRAASRTWRRRRACLLDRGARLGERRERPAHQGQAQLVRQLGVGDHPAAGRLVAENGRPPGVGSRSSRFSARGLPRLRGACHAASSRSSQGGGEARPHARARSSSLSAAVEDGPSALHDEAPPCVRGSPPTPVSWRALGGPAHSSSGPLIRCRTTPPAPATRCSPRSTRASRRPATPGGHRPVRRVGTGLGRGHPWAWVGPPTTRGHVGRKDAALRRSRLPRPGSGCDASAIASATPACSRTSTRRRPARARPALHSGANDRTTIDPWVGGQGRRPDATLGIPSDGPVGPQLACRTRGPRARDPPGPDRRAAPGSGSVGGARNGRGARQSVEPSLYRSPSAADHRVACLTDGDRACPHQGSTIAQSRAHLSTTRVRARVELERLEHGSASARRGTRRESVLRPVSLSLT